MDRPIQVSVGVHHVGDPVGVRENQGILEMILRVVQVSCLPANIPDVREADVGGLHVVEALTVKDLVAGSGGNAFGSEILWVEPRRAFLGARVKF